MPSAWAEPFREFAGRHAIVAGVGPGSIGATIASALQELGAVVTVLDEHASVADAHGAAGQAHMNFLQADLVSEAERTAVLASAIQHGGPPAYFVSTIGLDERVPMAEVTQERMRRLHDVNFAAPFWTAKDLLEPMRQGGGGSMLLFTSHHAARITDPDLLGYGTAKAALDRSIAYLATVAGAGNTPGNIIRVNGLRPGWVWTPNQTQRFDEKRDDAVARQAVPLAMTAAGLIGTALSILSRQASPYLTGTIIDADGGERSQFPIPVG